MPSKPADGHRRPSLIDRRVGVMFGLFLLLLVAVVGRAAYLGLFRSASLRAAAAEEHINFDPIPALRGTITDRNGIVLAVDESDDEVIADPMLIAKDESENDGDSPARIAARLAPLLHLDERALQAKLSESSHGYVVLAKNIPHSTGTQIDTLDLDGISLTPVEKRLYPRGTEAAQLLGWVSADAVGAAGVEEEYNKQLAGSAGEQRTIEAGDGKAVSVQTVKQMKSGESIKLTINSELQQEVESVLRGVGREYDAKSVTAIAMNPQGDQILALGNWPTFDPNKPLTTSEYENDTVDEAVGLSYEPGSTFKAITVAGALQDGLVTPGTEINVPSELTYYGKTITDAEAHGDEELSVAGILKYSSNIGADLIGQKLGADRFNYWVHRFGFGSETGVDLPDEQGGVVPKLADYSGLTMANLPFGQGLSVTPMQLITAYSAIANGGVLRKPQMVASIGGKAVNQPQGTRIISARVASEIRVMLRGVLADDGTASGAAIDGYDLAGKTGTANVVVSGKYSKSVYIASFVGMVPASNPKLVVAVVVDDPKGDIYGGSVAAPAFQKIVGWAVPYFGINPCPRPCPKSVTETGTGTTS
jgi:cell division protein FtsI (penicillin-binding protein 3)